MPRRRCQRGTGGAAARVHPDGADGELYLPLYTGAEQAFTVPTGITTVTVDAIGAARGADNVGNPGGTGRR